MPVFQVETLMSLGRRLKLLVCLDQANSYLAFLSGKIASKMITLPIAKTRPAKEVDLMINKHVWLREGDFVTLYIEWERW